MSKRILVVEDQPDNRQIIRDMLVAHAAITRSIMKSPTNTLSLFASIALLTLGFSATRAQNAPNAPESMRFFVTNAGSGKGGDLGGLTGADAHCQSLAAAVGAGGRTWHAHLSTQTGAPAVSARHRLGHGPWYNAKGTLIARDLDNCMAQTCSLSRRL